MSSRSYALEVCVFYQSSFFSFFLFLIVILLSMHVARNSIQGLENESEGKDATLKVAMERVASLEGEQKRLEKDKV